MIQPFKVKLLFGRRNTREGRERDKELTVFVAEDLGKDEGRINASLPPGGALLSPERDLWCHLGQIKMKDRK